MYQLIGAFFNNGMNFLSSNYQYQQALKQSIKNRETAIKKTQFEKDRLKATIANERRKAGAQYANANASLFNEASQAKADSDRTISGQMQRSFLEQVMAQNEFMDLSQQGLAAGGASSAKAALGGIQQGTTYQDVQDSQIREALALKKMQNEASRDTALAGVVDAASEFAAGSAYMNLYNQKKDANKSSYELAKEGLALEEYYGNKEIDMNLKNYLEQESDKFRDPWAAILLNFGSDAFSLIGSGYSSGIFGSTPRNNLLPTGSTPYYSSVSPRKTHGDRED
jgi:hypothetical protein